jgi:hypothetical protein
MDWFALIYRLFGACILSFFAFVPIYIGFYSTLAVVAEPSKFDLLFVVVVGICAALAYFLLLLAYRAATGRGRKQDGGLLPLLVMKGFVLLFCVIGVVAACVGAWRGELRPFFGGLAYASLALALLRKPRSSDGEP